MVTAYEAWSARLIAASEVDAILIGDSVAMVVHGHDTTVGATVGMMAMHTKAVARGAGETFLIADMPFLSCRRGVQSAMKAVGSLVRSGAHAVKLEGIDGHEDVIQHIVGSGVPVMGHLGLTPQSVHQLGGFKVQGRSGLEAARLVRQAHGLEDLGCFAVVLECVPSDLASRITAELTIPTIGIGAGSGTDGQVLVLQDLLGLAGGHAPRFVRSYGDGAGWMVAALNHFDADVKGGEFPRPEESYTG